MSSRVIGTYDLIEASTDDDIIFDDYRAKRSTMILIWTEFWKPDGFQHKFFVICHLIV